MHDTVHVRPALQSPLAGAIRVPLGLACLHAAGLQRVQQVVEQRLLGALGGKQVELVQHKHHALHRPAGTAGTAGTVVEHLWCTSMPTRVGFDVRFFPAQRAALIRRQAWEHGSRPSQGLVGERAGQHAVRAGQWYAAKGTNFDHKPRQTGTPAYLASAPSMPRTNSMFSATEAARLKVYLNSLRGANGRLNGKAHVPEPCQDIKGARSRGGPSALTACVTLRLALT